MQYVDAIVGNSSSGLIEAPSFHIGTLNIGDRQKGELKQKVLLIVDIRNEKFFSGIQKYSDGFKSSLADARNPHGKGGGSKDFRNDRATFF